MERFYTASAALSIPRRYFLLTTPNRPKYAQIFEFLVKLISTQHFEAGNRLKGRKWACIGDVIDLPVYDGLAESECVNARKLGGRRVIE